MIAVSLSVSRKARTAFACWDDRIAPVFDTARGVEIVEVAAGRTVGEMQEIPSEDLPVQKALRLVEQGVGTLVCGAISRPMRELLEAYGIRVVPFVTGGLREVIQAWFKGRLSRAVFAMPGCSGPGGRRFRGRGSMNGRLAAGPSGNCVCPRCGQVEAHERGVPCVERKCPKCGIAMMRQ